MTDLNQSTRRRLHKLPQIPSVWEGDRRPFSPQNSNIIDLLEATEGDNSGECILWVDGSEGVVRSMDMVTADTGSEAVVRALLRAMEHPHNPAQPARPQKIVVRDRQLQFYLRGVLQGLDIAIEYVPELPLINEIFRSFQNVVDGNPPSVPPQYAKALVEKAHDIWQDEPWYSLGDHQIISIEIKKWDIDTLYICVLGMLGLDYGIVFYRSLESLKRFRQQVSQQESMERLEEAFLGQDCLFLSYESRDDDEDDDEDDDFDLADLPWSQILPAFGNLHPLEGLRSFLYEEEALIVWVALEAIHRFWKSNSKKFNQESLPALNATYRITLPKNGDEKPETISVKVATEPSLEEELLLLGGDDDDDEDFDDDDEDELNLRDDLVPENAFLSLGFMPWELLENLRRVVPNHSSISAAKPAGDGLPIILIQTSRPKAKAMIEQINESGNIRGICFNLAENPIDEQEYDLGIFQMEDETLYLFGEFKSDNPNHNRARKKWDERCKKTKGCCGLVIAQGLTGAAKGNPKLKDMLALFEVRFISQEELGIGTVQILPYF